MRRQTTLLIALALSALYGSACTGTEGDAPPVVDPDAGPDEGLAPDNGPRPDTGPAPDMFAEDMAPDAAPQREAVSALPALGAWDESTLAALDPVVADAEVIALGEATHGSGGLHRARAHLIRRLVEVHGARSLYVESPWLLARAADDYVLGCQGPAEDATAALFYSIWFDAAIRDTLAWICAYNAEHADDPVRVGGVDVQNPFDDVSALEGWLPPLTDDADAIVASLRRCPDGAFDDVHDAIARPDADMTDVDACLDGLARLAAVADGVPGPDGHDLRLAGASLGAWLGITDARTGAARISARDTGMADMFEAQWSGDAPAILYLANSHASRNHPAVRATPGTEYGAEGGRSTGTVLAERFGDGYVAIATTAGLLRTNRKGTGTRHPNDGPGTVAEALTAAGIDAPAAVLDLGAGDDGWRDLEANMIMFGGPRQLVLGAQFDAVIALDDSAPMYDAVAAAYDGPYRDTRATFESVADDAYSQAEGGYVGAWFIADDGWQIIVRYRRDVPPPVDATLDLAGSNVVEIILAIDGRYWFAVAGELTVTEDGGAGGRFSLTGKDLGFWPVFRGSWMMPGPEAIRIGRFEGRSTRGG